MDGVRLCRHAIPGGSWQIVRCQGASRRHWHSRKLELPLPDRTLPFDLGYRSWKLRRDQALGNVALLILKDKTTFRQKPRQRKLPMRHWRDSGRYKDDVIEV